MPSSGGAACTTITRGENLDRMGAIWRKPPGTSSTRWPNECKRRSAGPKNPHRYVTPGLVKTS